MSATLNRLRVGNEDFLVTAMIERCPKTMMVRELLKNALEAADGAEPGARRVEFSALPVAGAPKLAIWNSGRGLNGQELRRMCNIATSIRKESGLDRNFGMGAKVASLPSNPLGMRYRSCKDGVVREVVIGKVEGVYGRLLRPGPDGEPSEVLEVTGEARAEGRDTGSEWTEVVLYGQTAEQNTVADPYAGQPRSGATWLPETVRNRFFRLPEGTALVFRPGVAGLSEERGLVTLAAHLAGLEHYEAVPGPDGVILHYAYDPELVGEVRTGVWARPESLAAVSHRDELYGVAKGKDWVREAPSFGIPFLSRAVSVVVELPEAYPVLPDAYREYLRYRAGKQDRVLLHDFAAMVVEHRPEWLTRLLSESMPNPDYAGDVTQSLGAMLREMGVPKRRPRRRPVLEEAPRRDPSAPKPPAVPKEVVVETAPELILLRDPRDIAGRGLTHRAATYYAETHQLHVNLLYASVDTLAERLVAGASAAAEGRDEEAVRAAARLAAERAMVSRVARVLAHGFSKRGRPKEWPDAQLRILSSPEMLTLAADDLEGDRAEAEAGFRRALKRLSEAAAPEA